MHDDLISCDTSLCKLFLRQKTEIHVVGVGEMNLNEQNVHFAEFKPKMNNVVISKAMSLHIRNVKSLGESYLLSC